MKEPRPFRFKVHELVGYNRDFRGLIDTPIHILAQIAKEIFPKYPSVSPDSRFYIRKKARINPIGIKPSRDHETQGVVFLSYFGTPRETDMVWHLRGKDVRDPAWFRSILKSDSFVGISLPVPVFETFHPTGSSKEEVMFIGFTCHSGDLIQL